MMTKTPLPLPTGRWAAVAAMTLYAAIPAVQAADPVPSTDPKAPVPSIDYQSAFSGYKTWVSRLGSWQHLNEEVTGGMTSMSGTDRRRAMDVNGMQMEGMRPSSPAPAYRRESAPAASPNRPKSRQVGRARRHARAAVKSSATDDVRMLTHRGGS